ncbi:MAG: glycine--tRNA ligase subunit beta [Legionellales bacterium]|jgi:glycyl-tRNA synthetase beta chain
MSDLLIEIGTEELPTQAVWNLSQAFAENFLALLDKTQIAYQNHQVFATPRRLALRVNKVAQEIPGKTVEHRGPPVNAAAPAIQGFADKFKVSVSDLEKIKNDKGEYFIYKQAQTARATVSELLALIEQALAELPIKKPMSWGNTTFKFVRPVHWALVLFGGEVLEGKLFDQKIGRETYGHRFLNNTAINIDKPENYENTLEKQGFVIADFEKRKQAIQKQIEDLGVKYKLKPIIEEDLLNEVTSIVEWPVAVVGQFNPEFLKLPKEVISLTLKQNQKCFVLENDEKQLQPYFITIANIDSKDPKQVISGNEKVVRARLSDAAFFFAQDQKQTLEDRLSALAQITYQQGLGSVFDKSERIVKIAKQIAAQLNVDPELMGRAALLCKADLTSAMVGEFPELQGIMGGYYAKHEQQKDILANAIREHYKPQGPQDQIPSSDAGAILALSDKLDTLCGMFGLDKKPTGDKDPFALRRAAIGVLRIIIEKKWFLNVRDLIGFSVNQKVLTDSQAKDLTLFIWDRFDAWLREQSFQPELFASVRALESTKVIPPEIPQYDVPYDIYLRVQALQKFMTMPEAASLATAHKRANNFMLKQQSIQIPDPYPGLHDKYEQQEYDLVTAMSAQYHAVGEFCKNRDYYGALVSLAKLKPVLDSYFDKVLVMCDDNDIRLNRLSLLKLLTENLFLKIADLSYLVVSQ